MTQNGLDLIKRFEGFSRTVYFCPAGYPAIGYGHVVKDDDDFQQALMKHRPRNCYAKTQ